MTTDLDIPHMSLVRLTQIQAERIAELEQKLKQLESQALTDDLTGLLNRRGFTQAFAAEQDRLNRTASKGGLVVMIDLDRFKTINDTMGHAAGDECLKRVADTLKNSIRTMDSAARMGGDEFALLLTNTNTDLVLSRVQHLALTLNKLAFDWDGQTITVGASLGIRQIAPGEHLADLLAKADAEMYEQKRLNHRRDTFMGEHLISIPKVAIPQETRI